MDSLSVAAVSILAGVFSAVAVVGIQRLLIPRDLPAPDSGTSWAGNQPKIVTNQPAVALTAGTPAAILTLPLELGTWAVLADVGCVTATTDTSAVNDPGGIHCRLEVVGSTTNVGVDGYYHHVQHVDPEAGGPDRENIPSRGTLGLQLKATVGFAGALARVVCEIRIGDGIAGGVYASGLTAIPISGGLPASAATTGTAEEGPIR